ncbi:D-alanyl-D-alanine carboxypeptidase/D-alanyl-D-alanine-endopeptidase [Rhodoferax koreense]|uniref:D-alanyl-D-alanine carboxypeptidase/D-alanyl-D-alanine-endopeptidase n=1 Tax=Rhodoferax koreensis TaxID=1842727 RepID=A0A1P8K2J0_9BURK|nr:D-alanyl-D-alanine carboxypeptidase/D-alanyl-D-alanine-endopeptidase [Rhodoferax koreense]APW40219.1 D-alanyl-D-alanine carboxypeptidase/D-alanyl-D-alanine-endopeptidase [Rhodoferax koreense]
MPRLSPPASHRFIARLATICLCVCTVVGVQAVPKAVPHAAAPVMPPEIASALARAKVPRDAVSLLVAPVDGPESGPPRLALRTDAPMNPASVMKLVTTYAGLDLLGADYTWTTHFYADGPLADGVLRGNLYIRGGGDPKLVLERVDAMFKALQQRGVREVRGDLVLDNSLFAPVARDPAEFDGEPLRPYNSTPDALLVNFKALILTFTPDGASGTARVRSEPPLAGVAIDATVPMNTAPCGDWRGGLQADFGDPSRVTFAGSYSAKCGERVWPLAYADPASYARRALLAMFVAAGGVVDGTAREGAVPGGARWLMDSPSLPLADIIADVNKFSNNVMAQQIFLTLSAPDTRDVPGKRPAKGQATQEGSRQAIAAWWPLAMGAARPAVPPPLVENGSGLSRDERITAAGLGRLLRRAAVHPQATVFLNSLSLAGVDGTALGMRNRGLAPEAMGNARLKTGTLRDVAAVAGYATGRSGQRYVVVGIVNHPNAGAARPALDALVEWAVKDR